MPRLPSDVASKADKAATGGLAVDEGLYRLRLIEVKAKTSSNQNPMWSWEFEIVGDEDGKPCDFDGRKIWTNTTFTDNSMWKVAEAFAAFGVPTDTDTDELIGLEVNGAITPQRIEKGARAGQMGNNLGSLSPTPETAEKVAKEGGGTAGPAQSSDQAAADPDAW